MSARRTGSSGALMPLVCALAMVGCASNQPPTPGWQMQAAGALERYQEAFLSGADRAAEADFRRAREALAATGDATQVARAELTRCALQVASLSFEPCTGFETLRADVAAAEKAYADYLAGTPLAPERVALLPPQHRRVAAGASDAAALPGIEQPVARLVAAGVLLRAGRASPQVIALASDTAARKGWRRPLLAWLALQVRLAEKAGDTEQVQRLRRSMQLVD